MHRVFVLFKLLRFALALAIPLVILLGLAKYIGEPYVEDAVAEAVRDDLDAKEADVDVQMPLRPGLIRGEVGKVVVIVRGLRQGDIPVRALRATVFNAQVPLSDVASRRLALSFDRVTLRAIVTEEAVRGYLRKKLRRAAGGQEVRVELRDGEMVARVGVLEVPLRVSVVGDQQLKISAEGAIATGLGEPIDLGRLPYGLRVRDVRVERNRLIVTGGRGAGTVII
jgi:hypothetical protein